jgi:3-isopropylmalate/(R)-2-methylmalate dehydratase large subunit
MGKTLFEKVWDAHVVAQDEGAPAVLYIDAHLIHEVTSPQAFTMLRERGLKVRRPEKTFATMDHAIPTRSTDISLWPADAATQVRTLRQNCEDFGIVQWDIEGDAFCGGGSGAGGGVRSTGSGVSDGGGAAAVAW